MSQPLRILHCVVGMNQGGYETLIMNIYRRIDRTKVQFDFVSSALGVFDAEIVSLGGKIHYIPFITAVGPFGYAKNLRRVFLANNYKIVHSHMDKFSGMVLREAKKCDMPVRIAHSHNTRNEGGLLYNLVKNYYGALVLKNATERMACSKAAARWMFHEEASSAIILYNGIDLKRFNITPEQRKKNRTKMGLEGCFVVGHVGRFTPQKNHRFILPIFQELVKLKPNAHLLLVGDGPLKKQVEAEAKTMGLNDKIAFLGVRKDIPDMLSTMDCMVFPSLHEGLGICLIEAQTAGVWCVVSDVVPEEAFVSANIVARSLHDTPAVWAKTLLNKPSEGSKTWQDLSKFDIDAVAKQMETYYLQLATKIL